MRSMSSPSGQGSTQTFTELARRAQITDRAIATIAELGYAKASLAEIGHRAGISKGVISYYFKGKDELLAHVVLDVYTRAGEAIASRMARETSAAGALRGYVEANLEFVAAHPGDIRAVTEIIFNLRDPDGKLRFGARESDPVTAHLEEILRSGQEAGEFRAFATRPMALILRAAIDAAAGQLVSEAGFDIESFTRELIALIDRAVVAEGTP